MKLFACIFLVLFSTLSFAQNPVTKAYLVSETTLHLGDTMVMDRATMRPLTGLIMQKDEQQNKVFECHFLNGKKDGKLILYCKDNKTLFSGSFRAGKPDGLFEWWYKNGMPAAKCTFVNGMLEGKYRQWYYDNQQLWIEENYHLGKLIGVQRYFSKEGKSLGGGDLKNGSGKLTLYNNTGQLIFEGEYKNSLLDGKVRTYFDNGHLKEELTYAQGMKNGRCFFWNNPNGAAKEEGKIIEYINGIAMDEQTNAIRSTISTVEEKSENISDERIAHNAGEDTLICSFFIVGIPSFDFLEDQRFVAMNVVYSAKPCYCLTTINLNPNNPSSSPNKGNNYFGDGGSGGGKGGGKGGFDGNGKGTGGEGDGEGDGYGSVKERIRKNNPVLPKYPTDVDLKIHLKLTVSGDGNVTNAVFIKSKSTTTDQTIINDVIRQVIRQVKYNKDPEGKIYYCYYTVIVNAK